MKKKVLVVFGTRPEAIKMAPVVRELQQRPGIETKVCVTAQHRSMLDQVLSLFEIFPDQDLNLMTTSQTLDGISSLILQKLTLILDQENPDLVLVHGDTTTTSMSSLACFYKHVPVGHVEAGLRTGNIWSPWPEELNRRITGLIAQIHFAPTKASANNLLIEKVDPATIEITGNTVIDALFHVRQRLSTENSLSMRLREHFTFLSNDHKLVLVTGHRRENFGDGMREICDALLTLSRRNDVQIVYAVHLNPNVKGPVESMLGDQPNIYLLPPQDYLSFVFLMMQSHIILTDSGGIQEEAPSLGKPVLVMRDTTERPEAVEAGTAKLVGANASNIIAAIGELLDTPGAYQMMSNRINPYGDGFASVRIANRVEAFLGCSR